MREINFISNATIPIIILLIILIGIKEKVKVYDAFVAGAIDGSKIVIKLFPTLLGLFVAIGALRNSGFLDLIIKMLYPLIKVFKIPIEIMPLAILRPISGSASMAIATDIMKIYGVDSKIGLIASTIMGSTETTIYTIAIYTECIGVKKIRFILIAALLADFVGIIISVVFWQILS